MALWTPFYLATPPRVWLKADDLGLSNGASVTSWTDSSGNGAHATVPGAWLTAPTFQTNQLNSLAIVRFAIAGTPQGLRSTHSATIPYTVLALARLTGGTNERVIGGCLDVGWNWLLGWGSATEDWMYASNPMTAIQTGPTTLWHMYAGFGDGVDTWFYKEGAQGDHVTTATGQIAGRLALSGANLNDAAGVSDCEIAEVIVCAYVISATERAYAEGYLAWKWGRQAALPGGHPYASAAPTYDPIAGVNFLRKGDRRA